MKKYFAIFASVAILGVLTIYFMPDKKPAPAATNDAKPTTSAPTNTPTPATSPTTTSTNSISPSNNGLKSGSYTGAVVNSSFGKIQVAITVSGGIITDVKNIQMPGEDQRSAQISSTAGPQLQSQAIAAQSANIDGVSGATYTSQGYAESLQSAIDAAKI